MLDEYPEVAENENLKRLTSLINSSSKRGVTLIQELINAEFLQSSEASIVKYRVDLVGNKNIMIGQYNQSPQAGLHRFSFVTELESLFVIIDVSKFMQVLNNLVSNALKFTPDDGTITISLEEQGPNVLIKVQDTGIGIPEEMQPHLFDKFTMARRKGLKGEPTVGLGMSIIKTIIGWHNGEIWFESEEGKGTTFYISIPKND